MGNVMSVLAGLYDEHMLRCPCTILELAFWDLERNQSMSWVIPPNFDECFWQHIG